MDEKVMERIKQDLYRLDKELDAKELHISRRYSKNFDEFLTAWTAFASTVHVKALAAFLYAKGVSLDRTEVFLKDNATFFAKSVKDLLIAGSLNLSLKRTEEVENEQKKKQCNP